MADFMARYQPRLPTVVPVEFMPGDPGEHEFTCQMGMLRGRIVVEAA